MKGDSSFSLMQGRTLAACDAERGINEDVYPACPGTDPLGILGYRGAVLPPHPGVNDAVAQAPLPPAPDRVCQGALQKEGGASWPSLPPRGPAALLAPRADGRLGGNDGADDRKPPPPSRSGGPTMQRRQGSGRIGRVGGRNGCQFLVQPSEGLRHAGGWSGCVPQRPGPTNSARRGVMGRPHGCRRRQQRRPRHWAQLLSGAASGLHMTWTFWETRYTFHWGDRGLTCPPHPEAVFPATARVGAGGGGGGATSQGTLGASTPPSVALSGHLGLVGMHPPTPGAPLAQFLVANGL